MLREVAAEPIKGIMMSFNDFETGMEKFVPKIQPLMKSCAEDHAALTRIQFVE